MANKTIKSKRGVASIAKFQSKFNSNSSKLPVQCLFYEINYNDIMCTFASLKRKQNSLETLALT